LKLVAFDLDSTLIDAESVDEFAKLVGKEKEVAEITKKAMKGKLKFEEALIRRAKLLKGLEYGKVLETVKKIPLMKGARKAVEELRNHGVKTCVISGSFSVMAERVKRELNLDYAVANELVVNDGKLTGEVVGPVVKEGAKGEMLVRIAKRAGVPLYECAAVGDGANDVSMFEKAGLKIAFNSKPVLSRIADVVIEEKDLTRILPHILGEADIEKLRREREELRVRISRLKKDIALKRKALREIGKKKREVINDIKIKNAEANKAREARDELNTKVKAKKEKRDKTNEAVKKLLEEYKELQAKAPKGDFKRLLREVQQLEWKLQTSVLEIKKEDAIVERIKKLNAKLADYGDLIKLSKLIDRRRRESKKLHEKILALSRESQHYHEKFLRRIEEIRKLEAKLDELNKQKEEIAPVLDAQNHELKELIVKRKELDKEIKTLEEEMELRSSRRSEKELKERASEVYERFKRGEKLDLEDIYLLRRFNLV
jgi:phosphoserine phosphatase